ncbi:MAG TPA: hypothetical protein VMT52_17265 [Planctomycetota bacterium]|nr:hypothetical protein [Planctomycetota bacterium]
MMNPADRQQAASGTTSQSTTSSPSSGGSYPYSAQTSPGTPHSTSPGLLSPASTGSITARADPNNNTVVEVKVDHLPPPGNIDPGLTAFVVWIRPRAGSDYANAGQLKLNPDRTGVLTTTSPHPDIDVMVTGESSSTASSPSRFVILRGAATKPH